MRCRGQGSGEVGACRHDRLSVTATVIPTLIRGAGAVEPPKRSLLISIVSPELRAFSKLSP